MSGLSRNGSFAQQFTARCLIDDRGRRVRAVRLSRWWPPPGGPVLPTVIRQRIRPRVTAAAAFRRHGLAKGILLGLSVSLVNMAVLAPFYLAFMYFVLHTTRAGAPPPPFALVVLGMILWAAFVVTVPMFVAMPFHRWYWHPLIVPAILDERHCATCGYSLESAAPDPDGCTVCPECGAAWRLEAHPHAEVPERASVVT